MTRPLRIVVLGYLVRGPMGGLAWHHLQYVLGLHRMGHDVRFVEDSGDSPWCCYDPDRHVTDQDPTYGLAFAQRAFTRIGLPDQWSYFDAHTGAWKGPRADAMPRLVQDADVLINVSGVNELREWSRGVPVRAFVDTDPVFTQIRHLTEAPASASAREHTHWFTFGEQMGRSGEDPDDGLPWQPTRQPIVLDLWPPSPGPRAGCFTTVMQWGSYPTRAFRGREYGMKAASFSAYVDLPSRVREPLELAVGRRDAPLDELAAHGWRLSDPLDVCREPDDYRRFIRRSKAEFTVAKHGYVTSRCGWFSERSAAYLASQRPVVTQDTGFAAHLPVGRGLLSYDTPEEAAEAIAAVDADYADHCAAARRVAEHHFDSTEVLSDLLARSSA